MESRIGLVLVLSLFTAAVGRASSTVSNPCQPSTS